MADGKRSVDCGHLESANVSPEADVENAAVGLTKLSEGEAETTSPGKLRFEMVILL